MSLLKGSMSLAYLFILLSFIQDIMVLSLLLNQFLISEFASEASDECILAIRSFRLSVRACACKCQNKQNW